MTHNVDRAGTVGDTRWRKLTFRPRTRRIPLYFFPKLYLQRAEFGGELGQFFVRIRWVPILYGMWQWQPVEPVLWFVWRGSGDPVLASDCVFEGA